MLSPSGRCHRTGTGRTSPPRSRPRCGSPRRGPPTKKLAASPEVPSVQHLVVQGGQVGRDAVSEALRGVVVAYQNSKPRFSMSANVLEGVAAGVAEHQRNLRGSRWRCAFPRCSSRPTTSAGCPESPSQGRSSECGVLPTYAPGLPSAVWVAPLTMVTPVVVVNVGVDKGLVQVRAAVRTVQLVVAQDTVGGPQLQVADSRNASKNFSFDTRQPTEAAPKLPTCGRPKSAMNHRGGRPPSQVAPIVVVGQLAKIRALGPGVGTSPYPAGG